MEYIKVIVTTWVYKLKNQNETYMKTTYTPQIKLFGWPINGNLPFFFSKTKTKPSLSFANFFSFLLFERPKSFLFSLYPFLFPLLPSICQQPKLNTNSSILKRSSKNIKQENRRVFPFSAKTSLKQPLKKD